MNETFEKIYNENNTEIEENSLFEKVYTEAKMLNEMNPKLRRVLGSAALAAALGMGTVGCSTPNDDYSEPPAIEQPANPDNPGDTEPETPEDTGFEDSEETETPETPGDPEFNDPEDPEPEEPETPEVEEPEVPEEPEIGDPEPENPESPEDSGETEDLVTFETLGIADYAESLAGAIKKSSSTIVDTPFTDLVYDVDEHGFVPAKFDIEGDYIGNATGYIRYISPSDQISYYVPESMESDFDTAIAAYKAAHAE